MTAHAAWEHPPQVTACSNKRTTCARRSPAESGVGVGAGADARSSTPGAGADVNGSAARGFATVDTSASEEAESRLESVTGTTPPWGSRRNGSGGNRQTTQRRGRARGQDEALAVLDDIRGHTGHESRSPRTPAAPCHQRTCSGSRIRGRRN